MKPLPVPPAIPLRPWDFGIFRNGLFFWGRFDRAEATSTGQSGFSIRSHYLGRFGNNLSHNAFEKLHFLTCKGRRRRLPFLDIVGLGRHKDYDSRRAMRSEAGRARIRNRMWLDAPSVELGNGKPGVGCWGWGSQVGCGDGAWAIGSRIALPPAHCTDENAEARHSASVIRLRRAPPLAHLSGVASSIEPSLFSRPRGRTKWWDSASSPLASSSSPTTPPG